MADIREGAKNGCFVAISLIFQMKLVAASWVTESFGDYFETVTSSLEGYEDICKNVRAWPQQLKEAGMI